MTQQASSMQNAAARLRVLQIGAGSMGTRRLRDLSERSDVELAVLDKRDDRRDHAERRFGIPVFAEFDDAMAWQPNALVISTPPDQHDDFVELALDNKLHHFCEENIWTYDYRRVDSVSETSQLTSVTSCSYHFLPVVQELKRIASDELGRLHGYQMALSTYMPGWHPEEGEDFYARQRHTAAAREMVPFELVWLNWVFGIPTRVSGTLMKAGGLEGNSEDTWCLHMSLERGGLGQLIVAHASPSDYRGGMAIGDHGWVRFDLFSGIVTRSLPAIGIDDTRDMGGQLKCMEQVYRDEINAFIEVIHGHRVWPHTYLMGSIATASLAAAERSAVSGQQVTVSPEVQPARVLEGKVNSLVQA